MDRQRTSLTFRSKKEKKGKKSIRFSRRFKSVRTGSPPLRQTCQWIESPYLANTPQGAQLLIMLTVRPRTDWSTKIGREELFFHQFCPRPSRNIEHRNDQLHRNDLLYWWNPLECFLRSLKKKKQNVYSHAHVETRDWFLLFCFVLFLFSKQFFRWHIAGQH